LIHQVCVNKPGAAHQKRAAEKDAEEKEKTNLFLN
jgi:hypothetical protein